MTNAIILLKLSVALETNWVTTSYTTPASTYPLSTLAVYTTTMANQTGFISSNLIGTFEWKGKLKTVVLESTQIGTAARSVDASRIP